MIQTIRCRPSAALISFRKRTDGPSGRSASAKEVLKFTTPVLQSGRGDGSRNPGVWAESDAPDTDFMAKPLTSIRMQRKASVDSALRARFSEGFDHEVFMKKGEVTSSDRSWSTSLIFNKGHRIAIHVSSSNDPSLDPNPKPESLCG